MNMHIAYRRSFCGFFGVVAVNIFSSVNKGDVVNIFEQMFTMAESCVEVRFTQLWVIAIFEHERFSR